MKRTFKSIFSLLLTLIFIFSIASFSASAAGTSISFSKSSLTVGDEFTVSVTVDAGEAMFAFGCILNYDSNVLEYKSGNAQGGAGTLQIIESPSGETKVTYSLTFSAKAAGSGSLSLADCMYSTGGGDNGAVEKSLAGSSASVTVADASLSSNANLKSLKLSNGRLSPSFSADRLNYTVNVNNDIVECAIYATASDSGAKVELGGSDTLAIGANKRTVTVTAPDGVTKKVYSVTINRAETGVDVSSEATESDTTTEATLTTQIDGFEYNVVSDISSVRLFKGFQIAESTFNGVTVNVAQDVNQNYTVYYLKAADSEELIPYTYNSIDQYFTKLPYYTQGDFDYILAEMPLNINVSDDFYSTNIDISGFSVRGLTDNRAGMSDFYYVYCYYDGEYGFYRYDSKENILQRYPELSLSNLISSQTDFDEDENMGLLKKFDKLTGNAKLIIFGFILLVLLAVALIVLLVLKFVKQKNLYSYDEDYINSLDFDDVSVNDTFLITDEDELNSEEEMSEDNSDKSSEKIAPKK